MYVGGRGWEWGGGGLNILCDNNSCEIVVINVFPLSDVIFDVYML